VRGVTTRGVSFQQWPVSQGTTTKRGPFLPGTLQSGHTPRVARRTATPSALGDAIRTANADAAVSLVQPATKETLFADYKRLGAAEVTATAALLEARAALSRPMGPDQIRRFERVETSALASLAEIGRAYSVRTDIFGSTVHGASCWPTKFETGENGRRRYINSFKTADDLPFASKAELYAEKIAVFVAEGGDVKRDIIEVKSLSDLEPGVRYDYCLLEDGTLRCAPRGPDLPDPGHSILAEGSETFRDTKVAMAGELWVTNDDAGEIASCVVACNSGHFKPFFDDLDFAVDKMVDLGVPRKRVIPFGGPNNALAVLPEIGEKLGWADVSSSLPPDVNDRRTSLRDSISGSIKPWQRR